jgi:chorismate mutase/prephenate dehydrogenase
MLEIYRQQIDLIDLEIIALLAKRNEISQQIGNYKQENNLPVHQPKRREIILQNRKENATSL